jgi:hypothetical protein
MTGDAQVTAKQRLKRSFLYATYLVVASTACVFLLLMLEPKSVSQSSGTGVFDIAAYVLGFPLLLGWLISTSIFGSLGSCATPTQVLGLFLTPVISILANASLIFCMWEFLQRKASRDLEPKNILHIQ